MKRRFKLSDTDFFLCCFGFGVLLLVFYMVNPGALLYFGVLFGMFLLLFVLS